jgi:hypothetical protein
LAGIRHTGFFDEVMSSKKLPTFREMSESGQGHGGYEPQQLWRVPIYLRSRETYYQEAEEGVRRRIDDIWELSGRAYGSREAFEQSETVENMWGWYTPVWWGLKPQIVVQLKRKGNPA